MASPFTTSVRPDQTVANSSWNISHWSVVIFAVSFIVFAVSPQGRLSELSVPYGGEAVHVARSLAFQGTFADPFASLKTGPTAHVAPVYPFFYAFFLKLLGTGYTALWALWAVNIAFLALQMALLPWLSQRMGLGILPGALAALLGTLSLHVAVDTRWDCFMAGLLLLAAFLLTEDIDRWKHIGGAACLGLLWGILILTNPVTVLLLAAWPFISIFTRPSGRRKQLVRRFAVMTAVAILTAVPWVARNYIRMGALIPVRDNFGLEVYSGNNPCAKPTLASNIETGCHAGTHPNSNGAVAAELAARGENKFNRVKLHEAMAWIDSNRSAFAILSVQRFRQFWLPDLDRPWETLAVWSITLLSIAGLALLRHRPVAWFIGSAWLLFPTIYYFVPSEPRYRYPIFWTSLLPAGYAVAELVVRLNTSTARRVPMIFGGQERTTSD